MERTLVLVRHGQTNWNVEERFQGQLDIPMNAVGRSQAEALKQRFAESTFDAIYSSPLDRAFETARTIAGQRLIVQDARLTEIHHGCWQRRTRREIVNHWPDEWERWQNEPGRFTPFGGESAKQVRLRVEEFLRSVRGTNVLCVTHGFVIQTLISILADRKSHVPANASVHRLYL